MTVRKDHALRGDMTVGSPLKKILWFAIPLFIGNIFQQVYNLADTAIAGYTLGDNAIAAIGATSSLYSLLVDFASGMNSGFGIVTAQSFGAKNWGKVRRSIAAMLVLNLALAAVLTAGSLVALRPLMAAMEVPAAIFEDAYAYIFVIFAGLLATVCYNMFAGILRAFGNSRTPLYVLVAACVVNLVLDVLFMVQFQWGVAGAHDVEQLRQAVAYSDLPEEAKDYSAVLSTAPAHRFVDKCMYCGHCAPCTVGIDIATVNKFYDLCQAQNTVPETVREHYSALRVKAGACIQCCACESRCPFDVKIVDHMAKARELFGE